MYTEILLELKHSGPLDPFHKSCFYIQRKSMAPTSSYIGIGAKGRLRRTLVRHGSEVQALWGIAIKPFGLNRSWFALVCCGGFTSTRDYPWGIGEEIRSGSSLSVLWRHERLFNSQTGSVLKPEHVAYQHHNSVKVIADSNSLTALLKPKDMFACKWHNFSERFKILGWYWSDLSCMYL